MRHLEPNKYARDEGNLSQELEWMHMVEDQLGSGATGGGRKCTYDASLD